MNINRETLLKAGYKTFPPGKGEWCTGAFQKAVRTKDGEKKAYFINIYEWKIPHPTAPDKAPAYEAEAVFYREVRPWFTLEMHGIEGSPLSVIEEFYAEAYAKLGFVPDVHNND